MARTQKTETKHEVMERSQQTLVDTQALLLATAGEKSDFDQRDMSVPRVKLLQALSPQLVKGDVNYIKAARPGDVLAPNNKLYEGENGILFIPCFYRREGLVFTPKPARKFVTNLGSDYDAQLQSCTKGENGEDILPNGNVLTESATYYGIMLDDETGEAFPAVISMNNTQWKSAKRWNSLINQYREKVGDKLVMPPIFWRPFRLTTDTTSNDKGQSWFVWKTEPEGKTAELPGGVQLFELCQKLRAEVNSGARTAAHDDAE